MANNYYGNRGNGSSLRHYRTKGSKNGYSKDPNYRPTGQRATGRLVNGRYVYDTAGSKPANVSQEYWDNLQYNTNPNYKPAQKTPKSGINTSIDPRYAKRSSQHGTPYVSEEYKQELAYNAGKSYTPKKNAINIKTDPRFKKSQTNTGLKGDPRYSVAGTRKTEKAKIDASVKAGAKNNWQQQANAYRSADEHVNMYAQKRIKDSNENFNALNAALERYTTDGAHLRYDDSYKKASKRVKGGSNINSVHNAQTERERSERARKSSNNMKKTTDAMKSNYPSRYPADENGYNEYDRPQYTVDGTKRMEAAKRFSMLNEISRMNSRRERQALEDRLAAGEKAREKRQKKREREAKINKMKNAILSVFKKKK